MKPDDVTEIEDFLLDCDPEVDVVLGAELYREPSITFGAMERVLTVSPRKKPILERVRIDGIHVKVIKTGGTQ